MAATRLLEAIRIHLRLINLQHIDNIIIRVYLNLSGMTRLYEQRSDVDKPLNFERFARQFNMHSPFVDLIDAGDGKECADSKIQGQSYPGRPMK